MERSKRLTSITVVSLTPIIGENQKLCNVEFIHFKPQTQTGDQNATEMMGISLPDTAGSTITCMIRPIDDQQVVVTWVVSSGTMIGSE